MKTILAFGDSNTYGLNPRDGSRFDEHTRWTCLLAEKLRPFGYFVAEDGVCGRTTVYEDPVREGRCGLDALPQALRLSRPDLVLLMLGTNDCKTVFQTSPAVIADGIRKLIGVIRAESEAEIVLISPILLGEGVYEAGFDPDFCAESVACAKGLRAAYADLAKALNCGFLAASDYAAPSAADREHMDEAGHRALADALAACILQQ